MKVKVGDNVRILAGKDRGKEGKIIKTLRKENKVVVEGINMIKKHVKPNRMNEVGSIVDVEAPIHVSNVKAVEASKKAAPAKKEAKVEEKKAPTKKETKTTTKTTTKKATTKKTEKKAS